MSLRLIAVFKLYNKYIEGYHYIFYLSHLNLSIHYRNFNLCLESSNENYYGSKWLSCFSNRLLGMKCNESATLKIHGKK